MIRFHLLPNYEYLLFGLLCLGAAAETHNLRYWYIGLANFALWAGRRYTAR